jgi:HEAT repeat protein
MTRTRVFVVMLLGLSVALAWTASPAAQNATLSQDELALKNAGIATDGQGLLAYFRRHTPSAEEQAALKQRASQLGSSIFSVRVKATDALIAAGRPSLPWLRETAKSSDGETSRRAQYCIQVIEQHTRLGLSATASRVLVERRPPGAAEALLAYLPLVDEAWVEEEIRHSLKRLASAEAKSMASLEKALTDPAVQRRAAAAWILAASSDPEQRRKAVPLLADKSNEVRFLAAASLLHAREPAAVPALIALLAADSTELAWRSEDLLFRIADDKGPAVWLDFSRDNNGAKVREAWEAWWQTNQAKIDWKSLRLDEQALGLTLVVENQRPVGADGSAGRIYECNKAGDIRWQHKIHNPIDAQWLPGGRILVADSRGSLIYEMDSRGVIGWKHAGISPTSVQRLANGNTVVSTYQHILELTREGKTVFTHATQGHTYHARKLHDGHYVWIDASGEIGEVDEKGSVIAKTKLSGGLSWGSIERLRNGHYLVALGGGGGKVQEVDMAGKVYWEKAVNNPNRAVRLANGHTLVASHGDQCVYGFDAAGAECWKHACVGRPFAALRR